MVIADPWKNLKTAPTMDRHPMFEDEYLHYYKFGVGVLVPLPLSWNLMDVME